MNKDKKWGMTPIQRKNYNIGLITGGLLMGIGFLIELITQNKSADWFAVSFPNNVLIGFIYVNTLVIGHLFYGKTKVVKWLCSVPASVSSIFFVTVIVLIMGFVPQTQEASGLVKALGLNHMTSSAPFYLLMFFFSTTLGFVTVKRTIPFKKSNIGFILNHLGLWIAIVAGALGSGDLQRYRIALPYHQRVATATATDGTQIILPFALELESFNMEEYLPKIAIVNLETGQYVENNPTFVQLDTTQKISLGEWEFEVQSFMADAHRNEQGIYHASDEIGAMPSAFISVQHLTTHQKVEGWLSSGSFNQQRELLPLTVPFALYMLPPEPKRFNSDVTLFLENDQQVSGSIDVNRPLEVNGWNLYQFSYNDQLGKWSNYSVLEAIRDPWLPYVYFGLIMMIMGSFYMIWKGKDKGLIDHDHSMNTDR